MSNNIVIPASVVVLIFVVLAIKRKWYLKLLPQPGTKEVITLRCREYDSNVPLENIVFRCSGEHIGSDAGQVCRNHLHEMSFEEIKTGYGKRGKENEALATTQLINPILQMPSPLDPRNKESILTTLLDLRCFECGRPIDPYCRCRGEEREHPIHFELDLSDVICLTGDIRSGKTVYFHMLDRFLDELYNVGYGIPVELEPHETRTLIRDNLAIMRETKFLPMPTAPGERMEVHFIIGASEEAGWPSRPVGLYMYDESGEYVQKMESIQKQFGFFAFSESLVLFIDPLTIPELAQECNSVKNGLIEKDELPDPFMIRNILDHLIQFLKERAYRRGGRYPVNLAVVVTKCDEYQHLFDPELTKLLGEVHEPRAKRPNLAPLDKIGDAFKQWLSRYDNPEKVVASFISMAGNKFRKVGYFPISSLGAGIRKAPVEHEDEVVHAGSGFISHGQALDAQGSEQATAKVMQSETGSAESVNSYRWQYMGELNPLYLDYPILWLYKHRSKK